MLTRYIEIWFYQRSFWVFALLNQIIMSLTSITIFLAEITTYSSIELQVRLPITTILTFEPNRIWMIKIFMHIWSMITSK